MTVQSIYLLSMNASISIVSMLVRIVFELSMDLNRMKHERLIRINQAERKEKKKARVSIDSLALTRCLGSFII